MKVSVIVPVFNEVASIEAVLKRIQDVSLPVGVQQELIVVDDGSTDGSFAMIAAQEGIVALTLQRNHGKGFAIRAGLERATGELVIIQDADLEYDPAQHTLLLLPLLSGEAQVVYGSRFLGSIRGMRLPNLIANKILSWLASALYGASITDEATGLKAFRAEVLRGLDLQCRRFEFCPEVTAKILKKGIFIKEIPIVYEGRTTAQGKKIRWWDGFIAAYTLLKYRF